MTASTPCGVTVSPADARRLGAHRLTTADGSVSRASSSWCEVGVRFEVRVDSRQNWVRGSGGLKKATSPKPQPDGRQVGIQGWDLNIGSPVDIRARLRVEGRLEVRVRVRVRVRVWVWVRVRALPEAPWGLGTPRESRGPAKVCCPRPKRPGPTGDLRPERSELGFEPELGSGLLTVRLARLS